MASTVPARPVTGDSISGPSSPPVTPPRDSERPAAIATLAKALGHPARVAVIRMLQDRQSCIGCDIVDAVGLAQSTTSEHLRILKSAGVITGAIDGPRVCYALNPAALEPLRRFLDALADQPLAQSTSEPEH